MLILCPGLHIFKVIPKALESTQLEQGQGQHRAMHRVSGARNAFLMSRKRQESGHTEGLMHTTTAGTTTLHNSKSSTSPCQHQVSCGF